MQKLLTYQELSEYLAVSKRYLQKLVQRKEIPVVKLGRSVRFNLNAIDKWLNKKGVA